MEAEEYRVMKDGDEVSSHLVSSPPDLWTGLARGFSHQFQVKALAVGANVGMMGALLAGTQESPGEYFYKNGVRLKRYRGMASIEAMEAGGGKRYFMDTTSIKVPQGVAGYVVDKGSVLNFVPYLLQGLRHSFQDIGVRSLPELHKALEQGNLLFERRSPSAQREGGVHGMFSHEDPLMDVTERARRRW